MQIFMDFLVLQIFVWFHAMVLKAVKDKVWYKLPLVGVYYRHKLTRLIMGREWVGLDEEIEEGLRIGSCVSIWAMWAMYP